MTNETYSEIIMVRETAAVKAALVRLARDEGSDVAALIRRAIRRELGLFAPTVPTSGNIRDEEAPAQAAA